MSVRLPRLLDAGLNEVERIEPETLSVNLSSVGLSTASMSLAIGAHPIAMHSWVELFTCRGSAGIFRVVGIDSDYTAGIQRIDLEHGICVLKDNFLDGDAQSKTALQWFETILNAQTQKIGGTNLWTLGLTPDQTENLSDVNIRLTPGGKTMFDLLQQTVGNLRWLSYRLTFDQSVFQWKIELGNYPIDADDYIGVEGRLSRNVSSARISYNDSRLCTRVYSSKLSGGYMDSANVSRYGIIARKITIDENYTASQAAQIAQNYLAEYDEPSISVEMNGDDLYTITGELFDDLNFSWAFRLAIPAYQTTVVQKIIGISYPNAIKEPERVTVTLANKIPDLSGNTKSLY